jgi:two-component system cell cycle sensor histidine kinase/response regulator CckA
MMHMAGPAGQDTGAAVPSSEPAIVELTRTGVVTSWNPGAVLLYGYREEEIVGRRADVLYPADRQSEQAAVLRRVATAGRSERYETDLVRKDGTPVAVSLTMAPIASPAGDIIGVRAASWELSGQQEAQDQIGQTIASERRLARRVQERTDIQRRKARDAQGRFEVNAGTQRRDARDAENRFDVNAGTQRRDARGAQDQAEAEQDSERRDAQDLFDARRDGEHHQLQAGGTIASERRHARHVQERTDTQRRDARDAQDQIDVDADTQRRDARYAQDQIDVDADTQRRDARYAQDQAEALQDSERRDAQDLFDARRAGERREALEQNEGLHAQVRQIQRMDSLGALAGGVAHDFNNLLTVILSYATFVSRRLAVAAESSVDGSWDEARADMAHIQHAVARSAALTRQLLAFASREAIRPLALDLNEVIANVEELLRRAIGEHIELVTSPADGLWPILADAGKLEQVLVNLAVNARDAMPDGGTLTISTQNIAAAAGADPQPQRHVQLQVGDTGTGMTADVIEHVFEPFFTTKAASRGTGLGLATVYGILTQADASIQISSQLGTGTTFTITLPVTDEVAASAAEPAQVDWEPHGETVLVVEDEDDLREAAKRIFAGAGYHVIAAASGAEAVEIARTHDGPIDLLVTDIVMPHMLGTEAARRIRAIKPSAAVLYMSGYAWPVHASEGRLDPDVALVEKPFSAAELLVQAGQALSGHHRRLRTSEGTSTD